MSSSIAILHIALNPLTGPWSVMRNLALAQAESGRYRAVGFGIIISKGWPAQYDVELRQTGLSAYRASTLKAFGTGQFLWQRLQKPPIGNWVNDLMQKSKASFVAVHFHNAWMSGVFLPIRESQLGQSRTVATFHGVNATLDGKPIRRALHRWMAARLPRYGARLTSVDRGNLVLAEKVLGLRPDLFTVIPNGVVDEPTLRATAWNGEGEFRVGHIGSITERKGWRLAAEAVLQLRAEGLKIRLIIAGSGPEEEEATQMARASGGAIEFLGHVQQPRKNLLPRLHALSVMSRHEGLPMTIIEAMAAGIPVMATAVGGIPEAVTDGQNGFLILRNTTDLVKVLRILHQTPQLWQEMSRHTRERFDRNFEISHIVEQYDRIYRELISA